MKRAYLFVYSNRLGNRNQVRDFIDGRSEILHWRFDLPNSFYLITRLSADELYDIIQKFNNNRGTFIICEVGENTQGWLPEEAWDLLNDKIYGTR